MSTRIIYPEEGIEFAINKARDLSYLPDLTEDDLLDVLAGIDCNAADIIEEALTTDFAKILLDDYELQSLYYDNPEELPAAALDSAILDYAPYFFVEFVNERLRLLRLNNEHEKSPA